MTSGAGIRRHLTAISRDRLSLGARSAYVDGLLDEGNVLDFGAGRGQDAARLRRSGFPVTAYDPYFSPSTGLTTHDVVLLTYVLNTIEDQNERRSTLERAWALARGKLVVTSRLSWERSRVTGQAYGDGVITRRATFQHLYSTSELVAAVRAATGVQPVVARPGVVYAFRSEHDRLTYLARRYALPEAAAALTGLQDAIAFYESRGRVPGPRDGWTATDSRSMALAVRRAADEARVAEARRRTTMSLLLMLSMERFHGPLPWAHLPAGVQDDIRDMFGSYKHASWRAARLLGQLRNDLVLRRTMRASIGKLTPSALYIHRRALSQAPLLLRIYEECGALAAGRPSSWDLVKLHHDRRMVSWLAYPDFDEDAHPVLHCSDHVDLSTLKAGHVEYTDSPNPPLLHRKEEFLAADDARVPLYTRLTASETRAGLYSRPEAIGTRQGWEEELVRCGRALRGHRLVRLKR